ncbi:ABC transporter substrate-binding protein [Natronobacterium texcoconense]|uniref:Carbohydrate ABC transporter substrate-binding protein, CUT1 family n=1 Tax=Natronobacterium texcoconense TaxID=1095778 RepID=A0A1H1HZK8_NATTX|nr:ABC transporter substrate-binding protein [Natronobacterium texcoconense]SDR30911.1 carbohydrate ABC transporter substrate-binding protein, CUT1 family [Natronobacterium texcoconense]
MGERNRLVDRRTVLRGMGAGAVGLAGVGAVGTAAAQDEVTVTAVWTGGEEEDFLAVVDHVEDETGIDISYEPRDTEAILTGTLMDYEAGVATADIVVMPSPARVQADGERGHLTSLDDIWDDEEFTPDPDFVTADGEAYAAPFAMDLKPGFWYRESFFEDNDLEEPEDYAEFEELLSEIDGIEGVEAPLASGNGDGWPLSDVTEAFILRQDDGAELQRNLVEGDAEFTDDRVVTAFEEVQDLLEAGYFSEVRDFGVQYEFFWENETPLYFMGSWTPAFEAIEDPDDLDYFMLPGTEAMVAAENWLTVPEYSENVEEARTAVAEFVSADGQQVWAERGGFIASNADVPEEAYEVEIMGDLAEHAEEVDLVPDLDDTLGDPFQSEFWATLTGLWAQPDQDVESLVQGLDDVLQETVEGEPGL